jgi:hypothetical protein
LWGSVAPDCGSNSLIGLHLPVADRDVEAFEEKERILSYLRSIFDNMPDDRRVVLTELHEPEVLLEAKAGGPRFARAWITLLLSW